VSRGETLPPSARLRAGLGDAPVISVVIPTFNRAHLLPAVLDSVEAQHDSPPFEVVVVDDASTDATPAVLRERGPALRVVRLARNGGVARARRAGAERALGAILAFHDSDDLMLPGRLGLLAGFLAAHPDLDAVFANGLVDGGGAASGTRVVPPVLARSLHGRRVGVRDVIRNGLPVFLQASLIRRLAYDAVGGIDPTLARHADLELACRLALAGRTAFLDLPVFRYRLHGGNQTRDRLKLRQGMVDVMRRLRERHPEVLPELGAVWVRRRERRHLLRIAWRHWMAAWLEARPGELVAACAALRQVLPLVVRGGFPGIR
jgi:glycosyltransferase involved in cell wall biosynthesis